MRVGGEESLLLHRLDILSDVILAIDQILLLLVLPVDEPDLVLLGAEVEHCFPEVLLGFVLGSILRLHLCGLRVDVLVEFFDLDIKLGLVALLLIDLSLDFLDLLINFVHLGTCLLDLNLDILLFLVYRVFLGLDFGKITGEWQRFLESFDLLDKLALSVTRVRLRLLLHLVILNLIHDFPLISAVLVHHLEQFFPLGVELVDGVVVSLNLGNQLVHAGVEGFVLHAEFLLLVEEGASDATAAASEFRLLLQDELLLVLLNLFDFLVECVQTLEHCFLVGFGKDKIFGDSLFDLHVGGDHDGLVVELGAELLLVELVLEGVLVLGFVFATGVVATAASAATATSVRVISRALTGLSAPATSSVSAALVFGALFAFAFDLGLDLLTLNLGLPGLFGCFRSGRLALGLGTALTSATGSSGGLGLSSGCGLCFFNFLLSLFGH